MVKLASQAPRQDRLLGAFVECIPPGDSDFIQLWSVGPLLGAWSKTCRRAPATFAALRGCLPQLPHDLAWFKLEDWQIGNHVLTLEQHKADKTVTTTLTHRKAPRH